MHIRFTQQIMSHIHYTGEASRSAWGLVELVTTGKQFMITIENIEFIEIFPWQIFSKLT